MNEETKKEVRLLLQQLFVLDNQIKVLKEQRVDILANYNYLVQEIPVCEWNEFLLEEGIIEQEHLRMKSVSRGRQ